MKHNSGVTNQWIYDYVVPGICKYFDPIVTIVLGRALLWRIFEIDESTIVPLQMLLRVKCAYRELGAACELDEGENLVIKVPLMVTGDDAMVYIDSIFADDDCEGANVSSAEIRTRQRLVDRQEIRHMNNLLGGMKREITDLKLQNERLAQQHQKQMTYMNKKLAHIMKHPLQRQSRASDTSDVLRRSPRRQERAKEGTTNFLAQEVEEAILHDNAKLSSCPRTLHTL